MKLEWTWGIPRGSLVMVLVTLCLVLSGVILVLYPVGGDIVIRSHPSSSAYNFPGGGRTLFPRYRLVALYGIPGTSVLGVLGAQSLQQSIVRVQSLAKAYQPLVTEHVLPTFEIIATVASATAQPDDSYSAATSVTTILSWVRAARENGIYVVLDLQPGRTDFLSQAKRLEPVLIEPNVGLALDPEWRLAPKQLPLEQIGSVNITEVNRTALWLAGITRLHHLPQKLFLLHQFRIDMLPHRDLLDTAHPELAYAIQMDGQGTQDAKLDTWRAILSHAPSNVYFGWKNFYAKDRPLRSVSDTMKLTPKPWYVSYQ